MSIFNYRKRPGYLKSLGKGLGETKRYLSHELNRIFRAAESSISENQIKDLENILIASDVGVQTTLDLTQRVREKTRTRDTLNSDQVRRIIRDDLHRILREVERSPGDLGSQSAEKPCVVFLVGVNGVGKTTTVGKLAYLLKQQKKSVLICAADTFRAAAVEQLSIWAERAQTGIVKQEANVDPGAVLFDALKMGQARRTDVVIVDTAGRLHTNHNLMRELQRLQRIAGRKVQGAPHEVYLVLDATTGQNGLFQAREFSDIIGVTGIIVTKLDGTAKGGILVAIARELSIPVPFIGVGESTEDLIPFSAEAFLDSLFEEGSI